MNKSPLAKIMTGAAITVQCFSSMVLEGVTTKLQQAHIAIMFMQATPMVIKIAQELYCEHNLFIFPLINCHQLEQPQCPFGHQYQPLTVIGEQEQMTSKRKKILR